MKVSRKSIFTHCGRGYNRRSISIRRAYCPLDLAVNMTWLFLGIWGRKSSLHKRLEEIERKEDILATPWTQSHQAYMRGQWANLSGSLVCYWILACISQCQIRCRHQVRSVGSCEQSSV